MIHRMIMILNIERRCDFCGESLTGSIYHPRKTRRGMEVQICEKCGLMQSFSTRIYASNPPPSMSCDADRASIRYTKDLIIDRHIHQIESELPISSLNYVLDIGSNRGAFTRKLIATNAKVKIHAVEPEKSLSGYLGNDPRIVKQIARFEFVDFRTDWYDFVYIAHTLEHLISASASLKKIYDSLVDGGYVFVAVPNMESVAFPYFEEQFIDTHTFHFTEKVLMAKMRQIGFKVTSLTLIGSDEICLLAKKGIQKMTVSESVDINSLIYSFHNYPSNLDRSRNQLKEIGAEINSIFASSNVIYWGAGRIFDGLIKIGRIKTENIICVVDKTLSKYMRQVNGFQIYPPSSLAGIDRMTPVIICSREYAKQIESEAISLGFSKIMNFMDFSLN